MQPQNTGSMFASFIPMIVVFAIFYLLLIRPQQKKEKERLAMLKSVKKNDEVVTIAGIHATILNVKDKTIILRIDDNVKMEVDREAVSRIEKVAA